MDVTAREQALFDGWHAFGMTLVGLLSLAALTNWVFWARVALLAALAIYADLGVRHLARVSDPPIDTFLSQQSACRAVLDGLNPYRVPIRDLYGERATSYPAGLVQDGLVRIGYFYPPLSLLLALPGYLLVGDHRYSQLAALLASVALIGFCSTDRQARLAAVVLLLNPRNLMYVELGFTDLFVMLGVSAVLWGASRRSRATGPLLGLLVATKPYALLALPLTSLLNGSPRRLLAQAVVMGALVTLPLACWDWSAFLEGAFLVHLSSPFRGDSLNVLGVAATIGADPRWMAMLSLLGYAVPFLAIVLCLRRGRRSPGAFGVALGLTLLSFFLFSKQCFGNYLLPIGAAFAGAAAIPFSRRTAQSLPARWPEEFAVWKRQLSAFYRGSWLATVPRDQLPALVFLSVGLWALMMANDLNDGFFCPTAIIWLTLSIAAVFIAVDLATTPRLPRQTTKNLWPSDSLDNRPPTAPVVVRAAGGMSAGVFLDAVSRFLQRYALIATLIPAAAAGHLYWRFLDGYPGSHWCSPLDSPVRTLGMEKGKLLWEIDLTRRAERKDVVARLEDQVRDPVFIWGFSAVGAMALLTLVGSRRVAAFAFPGALMLFGATGAYWIVQHPHPPNTDAYVLQQDGCEAFLRGEKPYSITIPLVFDSGVVPYAPELVKDGRALFGYTYPPVMLFLNLPAYALTGDHRHAEMLSFVIGAALLGYVRPGRFSKLVGLFYLFCPRAFMIVEVSWTDPIVGMLIALTAFCAVRYPRATPYAFGLLVASKQYSLFYIPLAVLLVPSGGWREVLRFLLRAGATSAILSLPLALSDWSGFLHSAVRLQFMQDWYQWSLGYMAVLWWIGVPTTVLHSLKLLPFLMAVALCIFSIRKLPRTPGAFALAICVTYLIFVAFNKQAFLNYYTMVFAAGCTAMSCRDFVARSSSPRPSAFAELPPAP